MENQDKNFKSSWNMAELLVLEANNHRIAANTAFIAGDYKKAMRHLISLKQTIVGVLSKEERTKLSEKETEFLNQETLYNAFKFGLEANPNKSEEFGSHIKKAATSLHMTYDSYNNQLMDLLQSKNLLLNAKKDTTVLTL